MKSCGSKSIFLGILVLVLFNLIVSALTLRGDPKAHALIEKMSHAVGGMEKLRSLRDVEYKYTYLDKKTGKKDVSIERYIFDGELSWANYLTREVFISPDQKGTLVQGFDGKQSWVTLDAKLLSDPQVSEMADFTRKTNFYWFAMMFKLLDPGVTYKYEGSRELDGKKYDLVRIGFESGVGDAQDTYLLFLNPETGLVDQFLFTVMDFCLKEPKLMKVKYEEIQGLRLPTHRTYAQADWNGVVKGDTWNDEIMEEIKFNNGFDRSMFEKPKL